MAKAAVWLFILVGLVASEDVAIKISKGNIKGIRVDNDLGEYYYAFKGIRYAKPPMDELRFKPPVDVDEYHEDYDATEDGNLCPQYDIGSNKAIGDEDCLSLNVYTPKLDHKKRAVMVYIHGGAFIMGGGASYFFGPKNLLEQDVILVTINYRLGALGFLTTKDGSIPANLGILDQIMALKWVQKNINNFGGDSSKVTIFGDDSGAASVSILTLSPEAKGLFHGAMTLSGNALCDHYIQYNPDGVAVELAQRLDCPSEKGDAILKCLMKETHQNIVQISQEMFMFFSFPRWFAPSVDGHVLPDTPENILLSGKFTRVPFVVGHTKDEGAFFYRLIMNSFNNGLYDDNFIDHKLPQILLVITNFHSKLYPITRLVRKRYFVNVDLENEEQFRPRFIEFLTDMMYTRCTDRFAKILTNHSVPTYEYLFEYRGQYSVINMQGEQDDLGVAHGDDLQYIFSNIWGDDMTMSASDTKFSKEVILPLFTSFAKTSVPSPAMSGAIDVAWQPTSPHDQKLLRIGSKLKIEDKYKEDILKFWNDDIPKLFKKKETIKIKKDEL